MKNKRNNELAVCGFEAVKALEKHNADAITRLYFSAERAPLFGGLCKKMSKRKAPYNQVEDESELEKLCGSVHHQGVVAFITQPEIPRLTKSMIEVWIAERENALLLDRVGNANNLGAIVRSAAFFGFKNIIIPLDEAQASITTSSYRVAQGGMEKVNIYAIQSIPFLLSDLKGKMVRFGTDTRGRLPISKIKSLNPQNKGIIIVLGNEENGISRDVKENCDYLVTIPSADGGDLDSLNVAQAASVILYELSRA